MKNFFKSHKIISVIIVIIVAYSGYSIYKKYFAPKEPTRYVMTTVKKETIISSVSGSGQVSALNQIDVKPKASGDVVYVAVANGQEVRTGALIAQLDIVDAQKSVRDAETALETAKLELDNLLKPADELALLQSENSLIQAKDSKQKAEDDLASAYESGFNNVSNVFLNLPSIMSGLYDVLFSYNATLGGASGQQNIDYYIDVASSYDAKAVQYGIDVRSKHKIARESYDKNFEDYKTVSRFSDNATIEKIISQTYETSKNLSEAIKSSNNLIQFYQDKLIEHNLKPSSVSTTHLASLSSYTGSVNSYLSTLLTAKNSIQNSKDAIVNAGQSIEEKTLSLKKTKSPPEDFDIRARKIAIQQKEDALTDAKQSLADCYIRAPFDGTIAKLNIKQGDTASVGTAVATLVTKQKLATISLNEIDAAKIKVGQKANISFDAIEGLEISGKVAETDTVGTVTQGVVTYSMKISFDTQDERVKTGMSVSVSITTDIKIDVLSVPNSAVKSQNGNGNYVEMFDVELPAPVSGQQGSPSETLPRQQPVEIGLSNDTQTEIVSGLKEGDKIVSKIILPAAATATTQAPSLFGGGARMGR